ncbi:MAG: response regulator [Armatimonadota bacterium]
MTLLLLEGQPAIRSGLRMWLTLSPDVTVVGEVGDGLAALSQASVLRPDVILMEIESIGMDGVELIKAMRKAAPESAVVVLSLRDDSFTRKRVEAAGAAAFVSKHEYGDRLLPTINRVAAPQHESSRDLARLDDTGNALT